MSLSAPPPPPPFPYVGWPEGFTNDQNSPQTPSSDWIAGTLPLQAVYGGFNQAINGVYDCPGYSFLMSKQGTEGTNIFCTYPPSSSNNFTNQTCQPSSLNGVSYKGSVFGSTGLGATAPSACTGNTDPNGTSLAPPCPLTCFYDPTTFTTPNQIVGYVNNFYPGQQLSEVATKPDVNTIMLNFCGSKSAGNKCPKDIISGKTMPYCSNFVALDTATDGTTTAASLCQQWSSAGSGSVTTAMDNYCTANPKSQDCACINVDNATNLTKKQEAVIEALKGTNAPAYCWFTPCVTTGASPIYLVPPTIQAQQKANCNSINCTAIINEKNTGSGSIVNGEINISQYCSGNSNNNGNGSNGNNGSNSDFLTKYRTLIIIVIIILIVIIIACIMTGSRKTNKTSKSV